MKKLTAIYDSLRKVPQHMAKSVSGNARRSSRFVRNEIGRFDRSVLRAVKRADRGVEGFVSHVEKRADRAARITVHALFWPARLVRRTLGRLRSGIVAAATRLQRVEKMLSQEVLGLVGGVLHGPGRFGRFIERTLLKIASATFSPVRQAGAWVSGPVRNRLAKRAKQDALTSTTDSPMTPDKHSHRELLVLVLAAVGLLLAAAVTYGGMQPGAIPLDRASGLAGVSFDWIARLSPLRLVMLISLLMLSGAAVFFWVQMARDAYRREFRTAVERTRWRLIVTAGFVPGAVVYFFKQYNRLTLRKFIGRHLVTTMVTAAALLVTTSTYGTLWYFNQKASAESTGAGYDVPAVELNAADRKTVLSRERYGQPLRPAKSGRLDPFAPIPGETEAADPSPSPSPSPIP